MNWNRQLLASLTLIVALADSSAVRAQEFFFKPTDRVVFYGDSITEQRGYALYIDYYLTTRFPDWDLVFFNAGASGDAARGGNRSQA